VTQPQPDTRTRARTHARTHAQQSDTDKLQHALVRSARARPRVQGPWEAGCPTARRRRCISHSRGVATAREHVMSCRAAV
jgi:hypothetical protein